MDGREEVAVRYAEPMAVMYCMENLEYNGYKAGIDDYPELCRKVGKDPDR